LHAVNIIRTEREELFSKEGAKEIPEDANSKLEPEPELQPEKHNDDEIPEELLEEKEIEELAPVFRNSVKLPFYPLDSISQ